MSDFDYLHDDHSEDECEPCFEEREFEKPTNISTKLMLYDVGWNGGEGMVSLDKLLEAISIHFPNVPLSSMAMTIQRESSIIIFEVERKVDDGIV